MVVTSLRGGTEPGLQTGLHKSIAKGTISEKRSFFVAGDGLNEVKLQFSGELGLLVSLPL